MLGMPIEVVTVMSIAYSRLRRGKGRVMWTCAAGVLCRVRSVRVESSEDGPFETGSLGGRQAVAVLWNDGDGNAVGGPVQEAGERDWLGPLADEVLGRLCRQWPLATVFRGKEAGSIEARGEAVIAGRLTASAPRSTQSRPDMREAGRGQGVGRVLCGASSWRVVWSTFGLPGPPGC